MKTDRTEKKPSRTGVFGPLMIGCTVVLFCILVLLTGMTIRTVSRSAAGKTPFDLERITAVETVDDTDLSRCLVPEMIGFTVSGSRSGISSSYNTVLELYRTLAPVLSDVLVPENIAPMTQQEWNGLTNAENSVYLRYHSELPDCILTLFADAETGRSRDMQAMTAAVYELFLLPYDETDDSIRISVRSMDGTAAQYTLYSPEESFTVEDIRKTVRAYRSSLTAFTFAGEDYPSCSASEPVFLDGIRTKNIIMTDRTSTLIYNGEDSLARLIRLFGINPDKLLNSHTEREDEGSFIDPKGVLDIGESSFEYAATEDGGAAIRELIGYTETSDITAYIRASLALWNGIRALNRNCTGGEAELLLTKVTTDGGTVTLTFGYAFDNLLLSDVEPAFTGVFADGMLRKAEIYTLSVRSLGERGETLSERWFLERLRKETPDCRPLNVAPVYRSDFMSESVEAEWCAMLQ